MYSNTMLLFTQRKIQTFFCCCIPCIVFDTKFFRKPESKTIKETEKDRIKAFAGSDSESEKKVTDSI